MSSEQRRSVAVPAAPGAGRRPALLAAPPALLAGAPTILTLALLTLAATLVPPSLLELTRGGEPWRVVTGHFVHWNGEQLLWDLLAFVALGIACERRNRAALHATLVASVLLIPIAVWTFAPEVTAYRGLSGIDSALFVLLLVLELEDRRSRLSGQAGLPVLHIALAIAFFGKMLFELATASTVFVGNLGEGVVPVPIAHLAGAVAALLTRVPWERARIARTTPLIVAPLLLTSCISAGRVEGPPPPRAFCSSTDVSGAWYDARVTPLGPTIVRLALGRDCRYSARMQILMFLHFTEHGHYRVEGNTIRFARAAGYETVWPFARHGCKLELQESPNFRYTYTRLP